MWLLLAQSCLAQALDDNPHVMQASEGSGAKVCKQSGLIDTPQIVKSEIAQLLAVGISSVKAVSSGSLELS